MATHSSVLAWRIPGTGEPGGLPSLGSHRVRHDWSDLAVAAAAVAVYIYQCYSPNLSLLGICVFVCVNHSGMYDFAIPWTIACLLCLWNAPGKNTRVGSHALLQGIFLTQGSNPGLLHCRQILYHWSYQVSPVCVHICHCCSPSRSFPVVAPCDFVSLSDPTPQSSFTLPPWNHSLLSPLQPIVSCWYWLSVTLCVCFHVLPNPTL